MDSSWNNEEHSTHTGGGHDFQQYFNTDVLANMNFGYQQLQASNGAHIVAQAARHEHLDMAIGGASTPPMALSRQHHRLQIQVPSMTRAQPYQSLQAYMIPSLIPSEVAVDNINVQIHMLQQKKQLYKQREMDEQAAFFSQQQNLISPPTPQSLELQSSSSNPHPHAPDHDSLKASIQLRQSQTQSTPQQAVDYRYQRIQDQQDMPFTPLVSPAVTPLETQYPADQFAVAPAYFSPLTSPALHAQHDTMTVAFDNMFGAAASSSPAEEGELEGGQLVTVPGATMATPGSGDTLKRARKAPAKPRKKSATVGKSPIVKPQRRKAVLTPKINDQILADLAADADKFQNRSQQTQKKSQQYLAPLHASAFSTTGLTDSETGSVSSQQPLHEVVEIVISPSPTHKPSSAQVSPCYGPQTHHATPPIPTHQAQLPGVSPATPASLMMLGSPRGRASIVDENYGYVNIDKIDNFQLPESVKFTSSNSTPTTLQATIESPPELSSTIPACQRTPSPRMMRPPLSGSVAPSSQILSSGGSNKQKTPQLAPGDSRQLVNISFVHASPALVPKISPTIKPLLPSGVLTEETASHLLATKSNYQRIVEGKMVPGVSYPPELSTNLTSKRASHKIAEQGRRNRMNTALIEMAALLPRLPPKEANDDRDEQDADKGKPGEKGKKLLPTNAIGGPNSKASTVEMAIEYIKQLKKEVEDANRSAEQAERKLDNMEVDIKDDAAMTEAEPHPSATREEGCVGAFSREG